MLLIPSEVKNVLKMILDHGFEAYLVGGFVRDSLLHKKTNDIDIATNALPKDLTNIFGPSRKEEKYGSYHLKFENYNIDITTYRKELSYENFRPCKLMYSTNMLEDAKRRDFTMNALYMSKSGQIIDLFNGEADLKAKRLKMIGNPYVRLREDPLRILRAVRFATRYNLKMDKDLKRAILKEKKALKNLSTSKIRKELDGILLANGFPLLKKLGLLKELEIANHNIVFVEDLSALWAQIKTEKNYVVEKELKNNQKTIAMQLKCGTIKVLHLYKYGYYQCLVVANILHFPTKKLEKMYQNMPIHCRKDIALSVQEIQNITGKNGREFGNLLKDLEEKILLKKVKNEREAIIKYLKERR